MQLHLVYMLSAVSAWKRWSSNSRQITTTTASSCARPLPIVWYNYIFLSLYLIKVDGSGLQSRA